MDTCIYKTLTLLVLGLVIQVPVLAQNGTTYTVTPLVAKIYDPKGEKDVVVVFHVSAKDTANFPPVLNFPFTCSTYNKDKENTFVPMKENVQIFINDSNIVKNQMVYELIKDKFELHGRQPYMILNFYLKNMTEDPIDSLVFRLSLTEKRDKSKIREGKYSFRVLQ